MKTFKRNAVIVTVMLFVCVAVYLNWSYNNKDAANTTASRTDTQNTADDAGKTEGAEGAGESAALYYTAPTDDSGERLAAARLSKEEARDTAAATLATVSETEGASQEMIDAAISRISQLADTTLKEAEIEGLIISKGFSDCVVYISDDNIKVTVPAPSEGLSTASVARICDIVTSETAFTLDDLQIIEVK